MTSLTRTTFALLLLVCIPLSAQQPLRVTIGKETTHIESPLKENGYPDYVAALNQYLGKGVTPENNLAVTIWQITGPTNISAILAPLYFQHLRIDPLPATGEYYIDYSSYIAVLREQWSSNPDLTPTEVQTRYQALQQQYDLSLEQPWTKQQSPDLANWLTQSKPFLDRLIKSTETRTHCFNPYIVPVTNRDDPTPELISILLPAAQNCRDLARGLVLLGNHYLGTGTIDEAIRVSLAIHRQESPFQRSHYFPNHIGTDRQCHGSSVPAGRSLRHAG